MSDTFNFDDTDPLESLAAVLTLVLAKRNPEIEKASDLSIEQMNEAKEWATDLFYALYVLNYRLVRYPPKP